MEPGRRWTAPAVALVAASLILVVLAGGASVRAATLYQTSIGTYDPRIDLRTDAVLVHMHGHEFATVAHALKHWQEAGNTPVYRMWFIGSDAGQHFTGGRFDGVKHTDAIETGAGGDQYWQPGRPYMVPTPEWNEYMRQITRHAVDNGVAGIAPEEPLAHGGAGYSPAFQRAWEAYYGEPWQAPHSKCCEKPLANSSTPERGTTQQRPNGGGGRYERCVQGEYSCSIPSSSASMRPSPTHRLWVVEV